jgi:hypothetical protein
VRAYFAPVVRATQAPTAFDPAAAQTFDLDTPPTPWIGTGWVDNFVRTAATKIESVRLSKASAVGRQFRTNCGATVELEFREWGKLQMALAGGGEHRNVLASAPASLQPGSTAQELMLGAAVSAFGVGDLVAVDIDYGQQTGYIGEAIAAAYVSNSQAGTLATDYLRSVSFNVGRVVAVGDHSLQLERPLLGGAPEASARVQKVIAFLDREGGDFFQEWSALFVLPEHSGGRICFYYPRLQSAGSPREGALALAEPLRVTTLRARFEALASEDATDGAMIYCQRIYVPPCMSAI